MSPAAGEKSTGTRRQACVESGAPKWVAQRLRPASSIVPREQQPAALSIGGCPSARVAYTGRTLDPLGCTSHGDVLLDEQRRQREMQ